MNCNTYNNDFFLVNSVSIVNNQLVLTFSREPTLVDKAKVCFKIINNLTIPSGASNLPVVATIGGANIPLWNKYGNIMVGSDLIANCSGLNYCNRFIYKSYIGLNAGAYHLIVHNIPREAMVIYYAY